VGIETMCPNRGPQRKEVTRKVSITRKNVVPGNGEKQFRDLLRRGRAKSPTTKKTVLGKGGSNVIRKPSWRAQIGEKSPLKQSEALGLKMQRGGERNSIKKGGGKTGQQLRTGRVPADSCNQKSDSKKQRGKKQTDLQGWGSKGKRGTEARAMRDWG